MRTHGETFGAIVTDCLFAGRVARAGRSGKAYSIVTHDEFPFLLDLYLFLGRELKLADQTSDGSFLVFLSSYCCLSDEARADLGALSV